jgi:hypothetical protein
MTSRAPDDAGAFLTSPPRLRLILAFIAAVYLLFLFPSPDFSAYNKDDAGLFVTLATNIARYGHYSLDTVPLADYSHHGTWPPVFPAILAAVINPFGLNWALLKLVMVALGLGNLALLWLLFERFEKYGVSRSMALTTVVATALSPMYFLFSHMTMTEIPFMCASTATLMLMTRASGEADGAMAGVVAALAFLTRGYAITLLPASFFSVQRREWPITKRARIFAAFALPLIAGVVAWYLFTRYVRLNTRVDGVTAHYGSGGGVALSVFRPVGVYLRDIYWYHLRSVVHLLFPAIPLNTALGHDWMAAIGAAVFILSGIGWIGLARRGEYATSTWLVFSIALTVMGQINGPRYWLTYLPFLILGMLVAVRDISVRFARTPWLVPTFSAGVVLSMATGLAFHLAHPDELRFLSPYWKQYQAAIMWAGDHVPPDAVIVTHAPHDLYGSIGIPTVSSSTKEGLDLLNAVTPTSRSVYVVGPKGPDDPLVLDQRSDIGREVAEPFAQLDHDHRFDVVYDGQAVHVWRQLVH